MKKVWNVAIYARVSTDKKEQQESIPAQVQGLKKWIIEKSTLDKESLYNLIDVYADAGFSGSNFERDSFVRMKEDIEQGKINMVVTRDLSRFARNYIKAGYYLEDYFKVNGIRYISVLDNVDTLEEINDIIPFKNILNEMYIKDCSRRTKDGLKQRMLRGSCISSKPPYGYIFEEQFVGNIKMIKLVPAKDVTTEIISEIFKLYLQGYGTGRIATYLNSKGIDPPSSRLNFPIAKFGLWTNNSVRCILKNPKYGGMMVQHRSMKVSYKANKVVLTPKNEWIYGEEFEGIVSKAVFEEVQQLIKKRAKDYRYKGNTAHIFSAVLKCNECGGSMSYRKKYKGYKCTNSQMGGGRCTTHSIKEDSLKQIIIEDLQKLVKEKTNSEKIYSEVKDILILKQDKQRELKNVEKELQKLDIQFENIYGDKLNEVISQRNFQMLSQNIQSKQEELLAQKEELLHEKKLTDSNLNLYDLYKDKIDIILNFKEFDRQLVDGLIDKIVIVDDKKTRKKEINIFYKFQH
ncbi:recombinase family protein [Clostridium sp.]|uniref:recombinase family protein n=1 Tax=Clostridium sp. TaxID=1506 RepID=UPI001A53C7CA|nr:recombinase family protein [Clostridium sp.]MBK5243263.1 recombinase family protein [Clostridium sp.]